MMRLYYLLPVCFALLGSVAWSLLPPWQTVPLVVTPEGDDPDTERILTLLAQPAVGWEFSAAPLPKFAEWLARELDAPVRIDEPALELAKIDAHAPIDGRITNRACDAALTQLLARVGLAWDIVAGEVVITTPDATLSQQYTRLYPVKDLVQLRDKQGNYDDGDGLVNAVVNCVDRDVWELNGAGPASISFLPASNSLVVSAPLPTQQKVQRMLSGLRTLRDEQGGGVTYYPRPTTLSNAPAGSGSFQCGVGVF